MPGRFNLNIRKNFSTEREIKHWIRLPREALESPSLEVFMKCVNMAFEDMVMLHLLCDLMFLAEFSNLNNSMML